MKRKDWLLIIVISIFSGVVSVMVSNMLLAPPDSREATVEVVQPISAEFQTPDERFFNEDSLNPTQLIRIGEGENQQPFANGPVQ